MMGLKESAEHSLKPSRNDEDNQLVQLAQRNPAAFEALYDRYFERVYRYCLARTQTPQEAEDLCSQVFIKVLDKLNSYKGGIFAAWLFRIAHNTVIDAYRKKRPNVALDAVILSDEQQRSLSSTVADRLLVQEMMADLSEEEIELLSLRLDAEMSAPEIGSLVGKSANAVRTQLYRLFKQLRARYDHLQGGDA